MENWVLLGILAALAFGVSTILSKVATNSNYFGVDARTAGLLMGMGIVITFATYFLMQGGLAFPKNNLASATAVAAVMAWAVGSLLVLTAFMGGADASKLTPIFNMNTLVVVGLGIILLHELPQQSELLRVVIGAVLVIIGGILVSI